MCQISEHRVFYIKSVFTTRSGMSRGRSCCKKRSSRLLQRHVQQQPHTDGNTQSLKSGLKQRDPSPARCFYTKILSQLREMGTCRGHSSPALSLRAGRAIPNSRKGEFSPAFQCSQDFRISPRRNGDKHKTFVLSYLPLSFYQSRRESSVCRDLLRNQPVVSVLKASLFQTFTESGNGLG